MLCPGQMIPVNHSAFMPSHPPASKPFQAGMMMRLGREGDKPCLLKSPFAARAAMASLSPPRLTSPSPLPAPKSVPQTQHPCLTHPLKSSPAPEGPRRQEASPAQPQLTAAEHPWGLGGGTARPSSWPTLPPLQVPLRETGVCWVGHPDEQAFRAPLRADSGPASVPAKRPHPTTRSLHCGSSHA